MDHRAILLEYLDTLFDSIQAFLSGKVQPFLKTVLILIVLGSIYTTLEVLKT